MPPITFGLLGALHIRQILITPGILMKMAENLESGLITRMKGYFCAIIFQLPILAPLPDL